jgi:hypothetical protein
MSQRKGIRKLDYSKYKSRDSKKIKYEWLMGDGHSSKLLKLFR